MNINRKIQLGASMVIASGALGSGLLFSGPALACPTRFVICIGASACPTPTQEQTLCFIHSGCRPLQVACVPVNTFACSGHEVVCGP
jgi:hypothetical protein